jgi:alpha-N-arabinofuranosidase
MICFDEWNILYRTDAAARRDKLDWSVAPALIEEVYNMEDALVVGGALVTLLNNADRVRVACLAQLVNVIAPIMAERGGPAWRQSIFHPFAQVARLAKGRALRAIVRSPCYATEEMPELAYLLVAAVHDPATRGLALFALNRSLREPLQIDVALRAFTKLSVINAVELCHDNLQAINSRERPSAVAPAPLSGVSLSNERLGATLKPASWNVIQLAPAQ